MDALQALNSRRTIHDYLPAPVDAALLRRAIEAGLAAPNHRMTEPWRFVQVGPETRRQLAAIAVSVKGRKGALSPEAEQRTRAKVLAPPELLVLVQVLAGDKEVELEDYAAIACAQQNIALALWAEGVGSKWSTGAVTQAAETYAALSIEPSAQRIVGFLWAGYAADSLPKARRRLAVADVLRTLP